MTDPWIGKALGRYQIEGELGRGGMGVVYRARQLSLNRPVAIKILPAQFAADEQFRDRFRQEARVIATLSHENIVQVYDLEEHQGTHFIVMELVLGQSLRALRETRRLAVEEIRAIGVSVARALAAAHQQGVVHRDVKSQNVMVTAEGKVKLMDFGIARVADTDIRTQTGSVLGTPDYMAPEQAQNGEATPQTDVYSLGVLLFELTTGRMPFTGRDPFSIALKHISETPPTPRSLDPMIPAWLEAVILRAMAKDPKVRYASASALEHDLLAQGAGLPPPAPLAAPAALPVVAPPIAEQATGPLPTHPVPPASPPAVPSQTYATVGRPGMGKVLALAAAGLVLVLAAVLVVGRQGEEPQGLAAGRDVKDLEDSRGTRDREVVEALPVVEAPEAVTPPVKKPAPAVTRPEVRKPSPSSAAQELAVASPLPAAQPAPTPEPEPPPARWEPPAPISETFTCREEVEFDVEPDEALITIDGEVLGIAEEWDGFGPDGKGSWKPGFGSYTACFSAEGKLPACVRIVLERNADEDDCSVKTRLERRK